MRRLAPVFALLVVGCTDLTEILVVVRSDLAVPSEIDGLRVEVTGSERMSATGTFEGPGARGFPRTVGVVRSGGSNGPITIRAVGLLDGAEVVERSAVTSFLDGQTRVLTLQLNRACISQTCPGGQTCAAGDCISEQVDPNDLPTYDGTLPPFDAGTCLSEICDEIDNDCDGRVDEDLGLDTNTNSCGSCGNVCRIDNATPVCIEGVCTISSCNGGFGDCNTDSADGCETSTRTLTDCGDCGVACATPNATPTCAMGTCAVEACDAGFEDCNMDASDGCEATLDTLTDCGGCGVPCDVPGATETCASGTCELVACEPGFDDCNMDPADGCEVALDTLTDCGACGVACSVTDGTATCASGTCEVAMCDTNFGDCNMDPADGCEENLRFNDNFCGDCMTACVAPDRCQNVTCR